MILIVLAVLCVLTVPLAGGSLARLSELRLRWLWTAPAALALQVVIVTIAPQGSPTLHALVHIVTYLLVGVFLWANRRVAGAPIVGLGALMNTLAIVANGGVMPASLLARRLVGLTDSAGFHNSAVVRHPHLLWLGDIIPIPGPLPNTLSIGDCFIFAGMLVLLHRTCSTRPVRRRVGAHPVGMGPAGESTTVRNRWRAAMPVLRLAEFERIEIAPGVALLRVSVRHDRPAGTDGRPNLIVSDGSRSHRLAPLPAPPDPAGLVRAAYRAPAFLHHGATTFALEVGAGEMGLPLPSPTIRRLRSAGPARAPDSDRASSPARA